MPTLRTYAMRVLAYLDAEYHIGLTPNNSSDAVAARNTTRLNAAFAAYDSGNNYSFVTAAGLTRSLPVHRLINFSGKTFYFKGVIKGPLKDGGGMIGQGRSGYLLPADDTNRYGRITRLVRTDGGAGKAVVRIRNTGFTIEKMEILGRPMLTGTAGTGTKSSACIEMEGRDANVGTPTGCAVLRDLLLAEATSGIHCLAGYWNTATPEVFVPYEIHADQSRVDNVTCFTCDNVFLSENQQALGWSFAHLSAQILGTDPMVVFNIKRGGNIYCDDLRATHPKITILRVRDNGHHANHYNINNFRWDTFYGATDYCCLFEFDTSAGAAQLSHEWNVRIRGHFANVSNDDTAFGAAGSGSHGYDETQTLKPNGISGYDHSSPGASRVEDGKTGIWLDIHNFPNGGGTATTYWTPTAAGGVTYTYDIDGPWRRLKKVIP